MEKIVVAVQSLIVRCGIMLKRATMCIFTWEIQLIKLSEAKYNFTRN
jgi:hypothetical protein